MNPQIEGFRIAEGIVQTPIVEFCRPSDEARVDIVGLFHYAPLRYFQRIRRYVNQAEAAGAVVHYEGMRLSPHCRDPAVAEAFGRRRSESAMSFLAEQIGFVSQRIALPPRSTWVNHDLTFDEYYQLVGATRAANDAAFSPRAKARLRAKPYEVLYDMFATFATLSEPLPGESAQIEAAVDTIRIDFRNTIALDGLSRQLYEQPASAATLLWGADHTPGLAEGVEGMGFEQTAIQWVPTFSLRPYGRSVT